MRTKTARLQLDDVLNASFKERTAARANAAYGQWRNSEPNAERAAAYAARVASTQRMGAETRIGATLDYQGAAFLVEGALVRRAIGYVEMNFGNESRTGTGFLIGPGIFITNQHVINNASEALSCTVTFDRELDPERIPLATTTFRLDPDSLFVSSPEDALDFAVVAVGQRIAGTANLQELGFCLLSPEANKHAIGMNVNIIQHPQGNYKQVAIRNNLLTYRTDRSLLYETDTEVGSSGSPVYNDTWDVIALHHYGQPFIAKLDAADAHEIPINANEGIRASSIHAELTAQLGALPAAQQPLLASALALYKNPLSGAAGKTPRGVPAPRASASPPVDAPNVAEATSTAAASSASPSTSHTGTLAMPNSADHQTVTMTVPLEITVRLGTPGGYATTQPVALPVALPAANTASTPRLTRGAEAARVDNNYSNRTGYQADFLPGLQVPMPTLSKSLAAQVAPLRANEEQAAKGLLNYEHFSLKLHKTRRVAIFTATNVDGDTYKKVDRATGQANESEADTWYKDPRISESFYLGQDFYASTSDYFDRGHLTRRSDPTWGTAQQAERANADTFHFSNCSPQHFRFNQSTKYWQGVERYILETGVLQAGPDSRLCVFQGPLYDDKIDLWIDGEIQIPSSYWKIVVWKGAKGLKSVGMVVDQLPLLGETRPKGLPQPKEVSHVDVSQWRVHIADIARRTELVFDAGIVAADTIGQPQPQPGAEAANRLRINSLQDIKL